MIRYKPPLPKGTKLIPVTEAIKYMPQKDVRSLKRRINNDEKWGVIIKGVNKFGDRYYVNPDVLRDYLQTLWGIK